MQIDHRRALSIQCLRMSAAAFALCASGFAFSQVGFPDYDVLDITRGLNSPQDKFDGKVGNLVPPFRQLITSRLMEAGRPRLA